MRFLWHNKRIMAILPNDNSELLKKISEILEVKRIIFTKEHEQLVGPVFSKIVKRNARSIFVYKILYRSQGHKVVGFIIEPKAGDNLPCVIYNRGGSGEFGALKIGPLFTKLPAELAMNGYVVITSQYSGNAGSEGVDEMGGSEIEDVITLQKILKKYSRANTQKIGMYGHSRGGTMTYLSLSKVKWVKAAITVGAPTNLIRQEKLRPEMKDHFRKMFGGSLEEKKKRSAIFWPHLFCKKTPLLIMHGGSDWRVSPLDSLELSQKLLELHIPHRLVLFEGASHGLSECANESTKMTLSWFDRFLKNDEPLPDTELHGA
ncbi:S9 family peptidase [Candidatus Nomurabacteria bacterium]|nr:S9 family peptidase [Candidatus Nomurabacteria bacterium]